MVVEPTRGELCVGDRQGAEAVIYGGHARPPREAIVDAVSDVAGAACAAGKKQIVGGDANAWGDFRGRRRRNQTHESKTDPESRLARKGNGREAKLCFSGHALMDNRSGLVVDLRIDGRTTQHEGYLLSQRCRMRIEQIFGWLKTVAGLRRTRHRGKRRTQLAAHMAGAAYNLLRMAKLMA